jgi:hypothetical protein
MMRHVAVVQPVGTGRRTNDGSTPNTSWIRSGVRTWAGVPSATIRPACRDGRLVEDEDRRRLGDRISDR